MSRYRLLVTGEKILPTDEYLLDNINQAFATKELDSLINWKVTGAEGEIYRKTSYRPHRRLISNPTPNPTTTPPMPTTPSLTRYRIVNLPKTKPVRCMVLIDNKVYVEGVTHAVAREIVAGHMLRVHPDLGKQMREIVDLLHASGL